MAFSFSNKFVVVFSILPLSFFSRKKMITFYSPSAHEHQMKTLLQTHIKATHSGKSLFILPLPSFLVHS